MRYLFLLFLLPAYTGYSQYPNQSALTIEQIMAGNDFIGYSPTSPFWSVQQDSIYFYWQRSLDIRAELYAYSIATKEITKVPLSLKSKLYQRPDISNQLYDGKYVIEHNGSINLLDKNFKFVRTLLDVDSRISQLQIEKDKKGFFFQMDQIYYYFNYNSGSLRSLYKLYKGKKDEVKKDKSGWIIQEELKLFPHLVEARDKKAILDSLRSEEQEGANPKAEYYLEDKTGNPVLLTTDGKAAFYVITQREPVQYTEVPNFIPTDGHVKMMNARPKVGVNQTSHELLMILPHSDSSLTVNFSGLPGIKTKPAYKSEYHQDSSAYEPEYKQAKSFHINAMLSAPDGSFAVADLFSRDNKDRWIVKIHIPSGKVELIDHQHDEAWIGGPGIRSYGGSLSLGFLHDGTALYFQSESDGYSHIYLYSFISKTKTQLSKGQFEISRVQLSRDKKYFLIHANKLHPGVYNLYKLDIADGKWTALSNEEGKYDAIWSPDEKWIAAIFSTANQPPELYLRRVESHDPWYQITQSTSAEFKSYPWRKPDFKTFTASDGAQVHTRVYRPSGTADKKAAVIFVHGAGYLQNAHKHWSTYYREYMFHHFLNDNGYTVLDIDYRGSAGYGRDWRTGIYRHMGGKDLSDHVDAIEFLKSEYDIDPAKIGIYGGSYGGFITLMALFQHPGTFACGAALRSVTDWAHYNHGYTSNILNTPEEDSLSYVRSSPIYFAENLEDPLLILHGMVDENVQFQDVVRLAQRLIELGKNNWEMAVFPIEDHGFVRTSSWVDEYKRIYQLFDRHLNK